MSSIQSALVDQPVRQFISTQPFNNDIFSYTVTTNRNTNAVTGDLSANIVDLTGTRLTTTSAPPARILRESGLKLYPGVNPGVNTFMVGVIDTVTSIAGYIDPNSPIYAVYSTKLPGFYANGVDPNTNIADAGPPVKTNGLVYALQSIQAATDISAGTTIYANQSIHAGTYIKAGTYISADQQIDLSGTLYTGTGLRSAGGQNRVNNIPTYTVVATGNSININCAAGQVQVVNLTSGGAGQSITLNAINVAAGAQLYLIISNNNPSLGNSISVTLGANLYELPGGALTANANSAYTIGFIASITPQGGIGLWEFGRTANSGIIV
jgi:hypothetical protein